jgi:hypothetical protein
MAIGEGVRRVEAGMGHYDYKLQLGGREHNLRSVLLVANRRGSGIRARYLMSLAGALHAVYYKLWVLRIAPHLSPRLWRRRPLWKCWIRTRL